MAAKPNIFAVVGSDDGRVKEEALRLHRELTGGNDDGFTHEMIEGTADNSEGAFQICRSVVEAIQTMPFFGGEKVVWLKNASFLIDDVTGRAERTLSGVESLKSCLEAGLGKGVVFLLSATGIDKREKFAAHAWFPELVDVTGHAAHTFSLGLGTEECRDLVCHPRDLAFMRHRLCLLYCLLS